MMIRTQVLYSVLGLALFTLGAQAESPLPIESTFEQFQSAFGRAAPVTFSDIASLPDGKPLDPRNYKYYVGENAQVMRRVLQKWGVCKYVENGARMVQFVGLSGLQVDGNAVFIKYHVSDRYGYDLRYVDDGAPGVYQNIFRDAHPSRSGDFTIIQHRQAFLRGPKATPSPESNFWKLVLHYRPLPDQPRMINHPAMLEDRAVYFSYRSSANSTDHEIFRNELRRTGAGQFMLEVKRITESRALIDINKYTVADIEAKFRAAPSFSVCAFYKNEGDHQWP